MTQTSKERTATINQRWAGDGYVYLDRLGERRIIAAGRAVTVLVNNDTRPTGLTDSQALWRAADKPRRIRL